MLVEQDVSTLTDAQRAELVTGYLGKLVDIYKAEESRILGIGGPLAADIASTYNASEQELLWLRVWVDQILARHVGAQQAKAMGLGQAQRLQRPVETELECKRLLGVAIESVETVRRLLPTSMLTSNAIEFAVLRVVSELLVNLKK